MRRLVLGLAVLLTAAPASYATQKGIPSLLYSSEGNRLRRFDIDTIKNPPLFEDILIENATVDPEGRDINGQVCLVPDGAGRFVAGEDTGQPSPPAGWGVFDPDGTQVGKLTATDPTSDPLVGDNPEPFGCAFDSLGRLFSSTLGTQVVGPENGQLIMWFPPYDQFPGPPGAYPNTNEFSTNYCKIATDIATAGSVAVDEQDRVYVTSARGGHVRRYSPPFPTSPDPAGGCGSVDALGSPMADTVNMEIFVSDSVNVATPTGIARAKNGNWYVSSVFTGIIAEYDLDGNFVRRILEPPPGETLPFSTGHPQGIAVDAAGDLYYADLNLVISGGIGPGPNGKVFYIHFDHEGNPLPPEIVMENLAFPDGLGILPGNLKPTEWRTYAGGPRRLFFNPDEKSITKDNVANLIVKWAFTTGAIVTASPTIARVDVPGEGVIPVVYILSWDGNFYALRLSDGTLLWSFTTDEQPGATFPYAGSAEVKAFGGQERVYFGAGETFYCLDAVTGVEIWRFVAGTGCGPVFPGLCGLSGERNEIESSPIITGGKVLFGMDINDVATGNGGFLALDEGDGRLVWFFDMISGSTCRPLPGDNIRGFDAYHSEAELGLPPGFLSTRPGCDFDRTAVGCGNIWSSPALDEDRGMIYFTSSNCDTDDDPGTGEPPPPMPPYEEAIVALNLDGTPAWVWRPREVDNLDLAWGAVPNLFTIEIGGEHIDVVGAGNKDGTYYLLDRDGINEDNGVAWDDPDPSALPYWKNQVVPGGGIGGVIATAAVDEAKERVYFSTAPGFSPFLPQRPTVHALDANTGAIVWQNTAENQADASFAPTSAIPGLVFIGSVVGGFERAYDTDTGDRLIRMPVGTAIASAPAIVDGILVVGGGIGARSDNPSDPEDIASRLPNDVTALAVETDGDLVVDIEDNCVLLPNEFQGDADGDLFGNACDGDFDQNGLSGFDDFNVFLGCFGLTSAPGIGPPDDPDCAESDMDENGTVGFGDFTLFLGAFGNPPGPSCCAEP